MPIVLVNLPLGAIGFVCQLWLRRFLVVLAYFGDIEIRVYRAGKLQKNVHSIPMPRFPYSHFRIMCERFFVCLFVLLLYVRSKSTAMVMAGRSVHITTQLTSNSCTYFRL